MNTHKRKSDISAAVVKKRNGTNFPNTPRIKINFPDMLGAYNQDTQSYRLEFPFRVMNMNTNCLYYRPIKCWSIYGIGLRISSGLCKRSLCFGLVYRNRNAPASSNTSWLAANLLKGNFGRNLYSFLLVFYILTMTIIHLNVFIFIVCRGKNSTEIFKNAMYDNSTKCWS